MITHVSHLSTWLQHHKAIALLACIIVFLLVRLNTSPSPSATPTHMSQLSQSISQGMERFKGNVANMSLSGLQMPLASDAVVETPNGQRLLATETSLSLKVNNVAESLTRIHNLAQENGGFLVSSQTSTTDGAASGKVTIRVAAAKAAAVKIAIQGIGLKVVDESTRGTDITEGYADIAERLRLVQESKQRAESMLRSVTKVSDLGEVHEQLTTLQKELDALKGQQQFFEQSSQLSTFVVYLATDELALASSPTEAWRPQVVVQEAIRALHQFGQGVAATGIWVGVFAPVWIPAFIARWVWQRKRK